MYDDIKDKIIKSFINGTYIYQGKEFPVPNKGDLKSIFEDIASLSIPKVYHRFDAVGVKITKKIYRAFLKEINYLLT